VGHFQDFVQHQTLTPTPCSVMLIWNPPPRGCARRFPLKRGMSGRGIYPDSNLQRIGRLFLKRLASMFARLLTPDVGSSFSAMPTTPHSMKNSSPSHAPRFNARALLLSSLILALVLHPGALFGQGKDKAKASPSPAAAETVLQFLGQLEKANTDGAVGLWDNKTVNDKLKARLDKMAAKLKKAGGIKKIDPGPCEGRRIKQFEEKTGEKIDVVPVEIICRDENLILAVFSIRKRDGALRIFQLESLKEWGGTASLDDELTYSH
jgi:hypothetical protein